LPDENDLVVLDLISNIAYMGTDEDGLPSQPSDLAMAPTTSLDRLQPHRQQQLKKRWNTARPLLVC
jgi:hypothetical protein